MNQPERGVIGIGEPPTISTAAAIANAVRNATGVDDSQPAAHTRQGARGARAARKQEGRCEGLCLRQRRERERSGRRAATSRGMALPLAGGMDLLALMKDYIAQPDRLVNVKSALDATIDGDAGRRADGSARR